MTTATTTSTRRDEAWKLNGACNSHDPDWWWADTGPELAAAVHVCGTCPVITTCLTYANEHKEKQGVWGGLTAAQRRELRTPGHHNVDRVIIENRIRRYMIRAEQGWTYKAIAKELGVYPDAVSRYAKTARARGFRVLPPAQQARLLRIQRAHALSADGWSVSAIASDLGVQPEKVTEYLSSAVDREVA